MKRTRHHYGWFGWYHGKSGYKELNPLHFTPWLLIVVAFVLFMAAMVHPSEGWAAWVAVLVLLIAVIVSSRRRIKAEENCIERGYHNPYHPVEGLRDLRCWDCGDDLPYDYHELRVRRAAQRRRQSYYSDRR